MKQADPGHKPNICKDDVVNQARWLGDVSPFGKCDCQSAQLRDVNEVRVVWPTLSILPPFTSEVLPYFRERGLLLLARPPQTRPVQRFLPTSIQPLSSSSSQMDHPAPKQDPNPAYELAGIREDDLLPPHANGRSLLFIFPQAELLTKNPPLLNPQV
jgi:hypothetical protein